MEWLFGGAKIRYFGPRPLIENSSVRLLASYPLSARLGHKFENGLIVRIYGLKLLNQEASQAAPGCCTGEVEDVHIQPASPGHPDTPRRKQW